MNPLDIKSGMSLILVAVIVVIIWGLLRRSKLLESAIDLDDLLLGDDGKLSKAAAVMFTALVISSWGMILMWLKGTMTEGYFMAYLGAWVAPTVTKLIVNRPSTSTTYETTTSTTSSGTGS